MVDAGADGEHHPIFSEMAGGNEWAMVRDGEWKYVEHRSTGQPLAIHDLATDPYELDNQLDRAPGDVASRLELLMRDWRQTVGLTPSQH